MTECEFSSYLVNGRRAAKAVSDDYYEGYCDGVKNLLNLVAQAFSESELSKDVNIKTKEIKGVRKND